MSEIQLVIFELDGQQYGIEMNHVYGIDRIKDLKITKIPNTPAYVDGVINLRNKIIPLYNLRKKFSLSIDNTDDIREILIVNVGSISVGLIVDEVLDIVKIRERDAEIAPDIISGLENKYISSIGKLGENMIIILDAYRILTDRDYEQLTDCVS